jgi:hypothetical protein
VSYRPWLEERALSQMGGLPTEALNVLVGVLARICETRMTGCSAGPCGR